MSNKSFLKMVAILVIPMALQNLINVGITSIDVIMLGRVNATVLSGASLGSQINFIMNLLLFGISSGASVLVAQYWGKNDTKAIATIFGISVKLSFLIGLAFTIVTFFLPSQLMMIFSNNDQVIREGSKYLQIVCFSYFISAITMIYLNTMRCLERVMIATWTYFTSMISNIIINYFLIFGPFGLPKLGIRGAAIGTVCARLIELLIIIVYNSKNKDLPFKLSYLFLKNKELSKDFRKYSTPVIVNELLWGTGMSAIAAIIGHMGTSAVAANSVVQVARQLSMVVGFGVASAAAITIGKAIGENDIARAKDFGSRFLKLSLCTGIAGSLVVLIFRPIALQLMSLPSDSKELLSYMMLLMAIYVIGQGLNTTMIVGIFRSGGDTMFGLLADTGALWGVSILTGFLAAFVFKLDIHIVYIFLLSDELIKTPISLLRYKSHRWLRNVTR